MKSFRSISGMNVNPAGLVALVGIVGVGLICAFTIPPAIALYRDPPKRVEAPRNPGKTPGKFGDALAMYTQRVEGRSLFYVPGPPAPPEDTGPKATVYAGPSLMGYVNGTAWFNDGQKLSADKPEDKSLKLIKANPPWSVRVLWQGGEFDVELFKRTDVGSLRSTTNAFLKPSTTSPPPAAHTRNLSDAPTPPRESAGGGASPRPGQTNLPPGALAGPGAQGNPPAPPPEAPASAQETPPYEPANGPKPYDPANGPKPSEPSNGPKPAEPTNGPKPSEPAPGGPPSEPAQEPAPPSQPPASPETSKPS